MNEDKLGTRPLKWKSWHPTFEALDVADITEQIWPKWLEFLESPQDFDVWLAQALKTKFSQ